jgi:fibronectin-binding autotransporter adhesin
MRPACSRAVTVSISVLCLLPALFSFDGSASAQAPGGSKRKPSQRSLLNPNPLVKLASARLATSGAPPPNTPDAWTGTGADNNWGTAGNWNSGVPTSTNDVTIGLAAANVNVNVNGTFGTLTLGGAGDTLTILPGEILTADGNISNAGTITLNPTAELLLGANVTLSGAGMLTLSNNINNVIQGAATADTLTNQQTIQGAGNIGNGQMTLVNSGTINANQSAGLTIEANGGATNTGTLEATAGATLELLGMTVNNAGGTISANGGTLDLTVTTVSGGTVTLTGTSALHLFSSTIHGGSTLTNSATGTIEVVSGINTLGGTINNSAGGTIKIDDGAILNLEAGTYSQLGNVQLNSTAHLTQLGIIGNVTLSGGTVTLSNNANNVIQGSTTTDTLTNQETIQGAGNIGNGQMTLVNSGTINANQSAGLTIQANGGTTNTGTLEATAGSTLALLGTTVNNAGGTISANASTLNLTHATINGGAVTLTGTSTLQMLNGAIHGGSTLTNSATGTIEAAAGANTLGGVINNSAGGTIKIDNGAVLNLEAGTYSQLGTVQLNSAGNFAELGIIGNVALSGGTLTLSNDANNIIQGSAKTDTLTNQETIQGAGDIGNGLMTLVNSGTINANQTAGLTIEANGGTTNTGTLEATVGSALTLLRTTVANAGGTISADGSTLNLTAATVNGGAVTLTGASTLQMINSTIHGGSTLTNSATGTIEIASGTNTLGGTINNSAGGTFKIDNGATLNLEAGTYSQLGTVQLNSTGNNAGLIVGTAANQNVTLSGGTVTLSNNANNFIQGFATTDTLTNQETIQGAGSIGNGQMGLVNSGTIDANASSNLIIGVSTTIRNTGTLEAAGGTLTITGPGTTFFTNDNQTTNTLTGGTYIANGNNIQWAAGAGGVVTLAANVTEENGGQLFNTTTSAHALSGLTSITTAGALTIGGVAFTDAGSFSNAGSLTLLGGESFTVASLTQINGTGTLTAGTYVLDANLNLSGATQNITTNAAKLTLAGGTIENANSTDALAGLATNTGSLTIGGTGLNLSTSAASFSNTGTLAINAGDSYTAPALTQISGSTLSGGTFVLAGNLDLTTAGISITTNSSTLTLEGGTINSNGVNALSALASNTKTLTIAGTGNNISTTAASFSNTGTLTINAGDSFAATALTQLTGTNNSKTLAAGTYVLAGNLDLTTSGITITKNGGVLTLEGGTINSNGVNALSALAANTGRLTIAGTANNISTTAASFSNSGTLTINSGDSFTAPALLQISGGSTLTAGTYVLSGNLDLTAAANITTNSATLTLEGGTIQTGTTNDLANLSSSTKSLTVTGNTTFSTGANFTNTGTVAVTTGSTLSVTGTGNSYNQSAGTTTVDGTLTGGGATGVSVTGGTIQGAGTLKANVSIGGGGTAPTINVGDAGKAGLLKITGTYAQLSTGTMKVSIGGITVGTKFSQLQITGAASLAGTVTAALVNGFTPTVGQAFTILTASSVTGTFTNSTIAINSTEHFAVSYTATSVVLTVATGASQTSSTAVSASPVAIASGKHTVVAAKAPRAVNGPRHTSGALVETGKPILVAGLNRSGGRPNTTAGRVWELNDLRIPHAEPVVSLWNRTSRPTQVSRIASESGMRPRLPVGNDRVAKAGVLISPTSGATGLTTRRPAMPVRILPMRVR